MKVIFINNTGNGCGGDIEVEEGTTFEQFFHAQMGSEKSFGDFNVTVNKLETTQSRVLRDGDTVTITPGKYSGARA